MPQEIVTAFGREFPKHFDQLFNAKATWEGYPPALEAWLDWNWNALDSGAIVSIP